MKNLDLKKFIETRDALAARKVELEAELAEINQALAGFEGVASPAKTTSKRASQKAAAKKAPKAKRKTSSKRAKNSVSLKALVEEILKGKTMTKPEVMDAVLAKGYNFTTDKPMNSLTTVLYSNKAIKRNKGKYSI